jgi:hypothetical protein
MAARDFSGDRRLITVNSQKNGATVFVTEAIGHTPPPPGLVNREATSLMPILLGSGTNNG